MSNAVHPVDELEGFYAHIEDDLNGRELGVDDVVAEAEMVVEQQARLPVVAYESSEYSSTLAMLRQTRQEVADFNETCNTLAGIISLPCCAQLKRTVANIFARPAEAEAISKAEAARREQGYEDDKLKAIEAQSEELTRDHVLLARELEMLASLDRD